MIAKFVIKSAVNGGFWSNYKGGFHGILFATKYEDKSSKEIIKDLEQATQGSPCEITTVYFNKKDLI